MKSSYRDELVGVFGYPIDENPSVIIEEAAFNAMQLKYRYLTIEVKPEDLENAIIGMKAMNMKGINITIPHKCAVLKYLDVIAEDAMIMGAVNAIHVIEGKLYGENTDGKGFLMSLKNGGVDVKDKRVSILGAGGVARAISVELARNGVKNIEIVNIYEAEGKELVRILNEKTEASASFELWTKPYEVNSNIDIFVNATPIGLYPDIDKKPNVNYDSIQKNMIVCDVIPNHPHTQFLQEAEKRGARTFDGLEMLVNQGALNFTRWTGIEAPIKIMVDALKNEFDIK